MFTIDEREIIKKELVDYLSRFDVIQSICLVGSNATGKADMYSDLDFTVIVKEDYVKKIWEEFYNDLHNEQIFRKFKVEFGGNEYLVGMFLKNALELDIGFTTLKNFEIKNLNKPNLKYQALYEKDGFRTPVIVSKASYNGKNILEKANTDIWYNFKNAMFALKRNRLFRCLNEIEESRNYIIQIISSLNNLESKHFKQIDDLPEEYKTKIIQTYPSEITYNELKNSLLNIMNLFYETLKSNEKIPQAEEYKCLFAKLMKDINL